MKKFYIFLIAFLAAMTAAATPLTPEEALRRVSGNGPMRKAAIANSQFKLIYTQQTEQGSPAVYIFNSSDNGYLVVSADDNAKPLLGYADSGSFDSNQMPPQMEWWLSEYASQIASAKPGVTIMAAASKESRQAIMPLMNTKWDQGTPYNNLCPNKYPTGCVATAMAQIMKKWNYPSTATGILDISTTRPSYKDYALEWDKMLDTYTSGNYNSQQANAVATLMVACGYSVNMNYTADGSGASPIYSAVAFSKNFKYNAGIQYLDREYFSSAQWDDLIYKELAAGRPVLYGGSSTSVGHEFVCDGYDGSGYYHFNWGWGGMSDGYFLLNALNPDAVGTGGGAGGGYNSSQSIVIGVQPTSLDMDPYVTQWGTLTGTCSGNSLTLTADNGGKTGNWLNMDVNAILVDLGVQITSATDATFTPVYVEFKSDLQIPACSVNGNQVSYSGLQANSTLSLPTGIPDGRYKVTVCSRNAKRSDADWTPILTSQGNYNFVYVTKSGNSYTVTSMPEANLTIMSASTTTRVYYNNSCEFKLSVANNSEVDLTGGFFPVLLDANSNIVFKAEGIVMSLAPGETRDETFTTLFELAGNATAPTANTNYTLAFLTTASGNEAYNWSAPLTMYINSGEPNITAENLHVVGATTKTMTVNGNSVPVFITPDASKIPFRSEIVNHGSFFGHDVTLAVFNGNLQGSSLIANNMGPTAVLENGERATVSCDLDFSSAQINTVYAAGVFYISNGQGKQLSNVIFFMIDPTSGVNDMEAETETVTYDRATRTITATESASIELYDLNGSKLAEINGSGTLTVHADGTPGSMAVAVVRTISGKTITRKILM